MSEHTYILKALLSYEHRNVVSSALDRSGRDAKSLGKVQGAGKPHPKAKAYTREEIGVMIQALEETREKSIAYKQYGYQKKVQKYNDIVAILKQIIS